MFRHYLILLVCLFICGCVCSKIRVCFTPEEKCTQQIIHAIDRSKKSILVQAYEFTSKPIAEALIEAKKRGISVKVILDDSQIYSKYSVMNTLFDQNIPIWIDYKPAISHSKIVIIDNKTIITGSFNFTHSAEFRNAENLLIIENNSSLVKQYIANWKNRQFQSKVYSPQITHASNALF